MRCRWTEAARAGGTQNAGTRNATQTYPKTSRAVKVQPGVIQRANAKQAPPVLECLLFSIEEERSCLGAALMNTDQAEELLRKASLDLFFHEPHRAILRAMRRLGAPLELLQLIAELDRAGELELAGGADYVSSLDYGVVTERPFAGRVARLRDLRDLRALRSLAQEILNAVHVPLVKADDVFARIERRLQELRA